jgi:hypothetical protein
MGFISVAECEVLRNNALINIHMAHTAAEMGIPRYFFSSSVCVYRDMQPGEPELTEDGAISAHPDNEYGWEKLYAEQVAQAYGRRYGMRARIARFENCYGPEGILRQAQYDAQGRPGPGGEKRLQRRFAVRLRKQRTVGRSRSGAMDRAQDKAQYKHARDGGGGWKGEGENGKQLSGRARTWREEVPDGDARGGIRSGEKPAGRVDRRGIELH